MLHIIPFTPSHLKKPLTQRSRIRVPAQSMLAGSVCPRTPRRSAPREYLSQNARRRQCAGRLCSTWRMRRCPAECRPAVAAGKARAAPRRPRACAACWPPSRPTSPCRLRTRAPPGCPTWSSRTRPCHTSPTTGKHRIWQGNTKCSIVKKKHCIFSGNFLKFTYIDML